MKRILVMFMTLGLIGGSVMVAEATQTSRGRGRTVETTYYGSHLLYQFGPCPVSGGGGCVKVETRAHERFLTARVSDAQGQPLPVRVVGVSDPELKETRFGWFCGETTEPIRFTPGTELELWIGGDWWPRWWIVPEFDCSPGPATTGTVQVTLSSSVEAEPQPSTSIHGAAAEKSGPERRSVEFALEEHLRAHGLVQSGDRSCLAGVKVAIQRKRSDGWLTVASTTTDILGAYGVGLRDRGGSYRARVSDADSAQRRCMNAVSETLRHRH